MGGGYTARLSAPMWIWHESYEIGNPWCCVRVYWMKSLGPLHLDMNAFALKNSAEEKSKSSWRELESCKKDRWACLPDEQGSLFNELTLMLCKCDLLDLSCSTLMTPPVETLVETTTEIFQEPTSHPSHQRGAKTTHSHWRNLKT